ncbi:thioesterase family protein [Arenibaculum sp.]|jgi:acyl-CoA thioester hydrolase|uniref:acyl-CoA thioesterase n=1 Tax=Arenibaculum sp. TaxID=2865862 RepID=UPI002E11D7FD|nr:thioesterase family protein [Arenibaculum sp.]
MEAPTRAGYRHFLAVPTRWMDNDVYGHVNNVVYYSYVDTIVNQYLVEAGGLDIHAGPVIGIVVESHCTYHAPVAFPDVLEGALRVGRIGTSSVRYEVAVFRGGEERAAASAHFVHVFVDRATRRPVPVPAPLRAALERILVASP